MATTHVESGNTTCDYPDLYGKQKTCLPVTHEGRLVGESGPTICHKDSCEADIGGFHVFPKMQIIKSSPWKYGYSNGLLDGKVSARDATDACSNYNSTADNNECAHGYDLGFKKGCQMKGDKLPIDPSPEYGQCRDG